MAITAAMVKELREMTGAGMMDCKKALTKTEGAGEQARNMIVAMHQLVPPQGECRDDYWIGSELARRIGVFDAFTERKTLEDWIRATYEKAAKTAELSLDMSPWQFCQKLSCHSTPCRPLRNSGDPGS